jgi:hypothetical protein
MAYHPNTEQQVRTAGTSQVPTGEARPGSTGESSGSENVGETGSQEFDRRNRGLKSSWRSQGTAGETEVQQEQQEVRIPTEQKSGDRRNRGIRFFGQGIQEFNWEGGAGAWFNRETGSEFNKTLGESGVNRRNKIPTGKQGESVQQENKVLSGTLEVKSNKEKQERRSSTELEIRVLWRNKQVQQESSVNFQQGLEQSNRETRQGFNRRNKSRFNRSLEVDAGANSNSTNKRIKLLSRKLSKEVKRQTSRVQQEKQVKFNRQSQDNRRNRSQVQQEKQEMGSDRRNREAGLGETGGQEFNRFQQVSGLTRSGCASSPRDNRYPRPNRSGWLSSN